MHVIVTGAGGNLGKAVVEKLLAAGHTVTGTVSPGRLQTGLLPGYDIKEIDLADEERTSSLVDDIIHDHGRIGAAVLTAGGFAMGDMAKTRSADIMSQYQVNFETAYHIARPVFLHMKKQGGGQIFLIGSKPGIDMHQAKGMIGYALAKSLIFRLAELLNDEGKQDNVVTSVIVPGTIDTPQNRTAMPSADFDTWVKPEAIAEIITLHLDAKLAEVREPVIKVYGKSS